jgi:EAL and modified HD-GYP domain-containing signal transduction protein
MSASVLGNITLGYEPLWDARRRRIGVRLRVTPHRSSAVDANHLVVALSDLFGKSKQTVLLSVDSNALLNDLLDHASDAQLWIEVNQAALSDALLAGRVRKAHQRGLSTVWHGEAGQIPTGEVQAWFRTSLRSLSPEQALDALRVSLRQHQDGGLGSGSPLQSPVEDGQLYMGLASQALVEHALDRQHVAGVVGWPNEEMLYGYRFRQIQPSQHLMMLLLKAIDDDVSLEQIEHEMCNEPLLAYRFLRYANSAHLGARSEITNIRQGLMVMGYGRLKTWLLEQLPHASADLNLDPIRTSMVLRARIMEQLSDAGVEDELRREVFLCGLFSQMDLLTGEPLGAAIHRVPLPGRIASAVVGQSGPYAAWLQVATVLETGNTRLIRDVCAAHQLESDEVNRALLRALASV